MIYIIVQIVISIISAILGVRFLLEKKKAWVLVIVIIYFTLIIYSIITANKNKIELEKYFRQEVATIKQQSNNQEKLLIDSDNKLQKTFNEINKKLDKEFSDGSDKTDKDWLRFIGLKLETLLFEIRSQRYKSNQVRFNDYLYSLSLLPSNMDLNDWQYFEEKYYRNALNSIVEELVARNVADSGVGKAKKQEFKELREKYLESKKKNLTK